MVNPKTFNLSIAVALFVLFFWSCYRIFFSNSIEIDEYIFKPLIWLLPTFVTVLYLEKNNLKSFAYHPTRFTMILGIVFGLILAGERLGTIWLKYSQFTYTSSLSNIITLLLTSLATAFVEETFFRGYLLNRWLKYFKHPLVPLLLNAAFFTSTHLPYVIFQLHYSGRDLYTYLLSNFISGFADVLLFYKTRDTTASVANHFVWNFFSGFIK